MLAEPLVFVGRARDHMASCDRPGQARFHLVFPAEPMALRKALSQAMKFLRGLEFGQDACGLVELVLAEAINNVIEHAYAGDGHGVVELSICQAGEKLSFEILDDGLPMPQGELPKGKAHDLERPMSEMPEGGFGWFLIHELTTELAYQRLGTRNRLCFSMAPAALPQ